jgi:hypothetical protein
MFICCFVTRFNKNGSSTTSDFSVNIDVLFSIIIKLSRPKDIFLLSHSGTSHNV